MGEGIDPTTVDADPLVQLHEWLSLAWDRGLFNANAMALATVDSDGLPHVRNVLARIVDGELTFHTNYESAKGVELAVHPRAEALFSWLELERQVRVAGPVSKLPAAASDAYWDARPRESQLSALASAQSQPVDDRAALERRVEALDAEHADRPVPRPSHCGGYDLAADYYEFWHSRHGRLHDRVRYRLQNGSWSRDRLQP